MVSLILSQRNDHTALQLLTDKATGFIVKLEASADGRKPGNVEDEKQRAMKVNTIFKMTNQKDNARVEFESSSID